MHRIALYIVITAILGCSSKQLNTPIQEDEAARLRSMDKQHFIDTIKIKDDQFELYAVISTQNGFIQHWPPGNKIQSDAFLRGFIDKKTQSKSFQVYIKLKHYMGDWLFPYQANYGRPLRKSDTNRVSGDVSCSYQCRYNEQITFSVEEDELRRMKTLSAEEVATKVWIFKLKTKSGHDIMEGFNVNEILALLDVIDSYKTVQTLE